MQTGTGLNAAIGKLVQRLRALRSAWGVLAPSGLSAEKYDIASTGRALNDELMELITRGAADPDFEAMAKIEVGLDALESEMRSIACKVPVSQLRSTLPDCVSQNRRGVLDLLDLMLGAELLELEGTESRIPAIDYLITLLCSAGPDQPPLDPVQLTPRLHELCERTGGEYDPRLPDIEAEFFHAADLYEAESRGELELRALRTRKKELGVSYFSPQVLRAIVTYNVALLQRIDEEVLASQDWGSLPPVVEEPPRAVSVFNTTCLPEIARALMRRVAGKAPELTAVDRIAWCLDLEYPNPDERRALLKETAGRPGNLAGTVVLVGLLCRSSVVLEDEFPAIGTSESQLFDAWVPELSEVLQRRVNRGISGDDYREACILSELKARYLFASMAEMRSIQSRVPAPKPPAPQTPEAGERAKAREEAKAAESILREALVDVEDSAEKAGRTAGGPMSTRRLAAIGVAIATVLLVIAAEQVFHWNDDQVRFNRAQLDHVSRYLARGARDGNGLGAAFVGEIQDSWSALDAADRVLVATDLVESLREKGVRDVMIYDDDGLLRIQALGYQPPRILPDPGP